MRNPLHTDPISRRFYKDLAGSVDAFLLEMRPSDIRVYCEFTKIQEAPATTSRRKAAGAGFRLAESIPWGGLRARFKTPTGGIRHGVVKTVCYRVSSV